jgi:hypothetical protein
MPRYLNTRGNTTLAIGICGRCSIKMPLDKLLPDPNYPGLLVCEKDRDEYDPYRLPARQPDNIVLPFTRPDAPVGTDPAGVITQDGDYFLITEDGEDYLEP